MSSISRSMLKGDDRRVVQNWTIAYGKPQRQQLDSDLSALIPLSKRVEKWRN
jgi:hypothetical protein